MKLECKPFTPEIHRAKETVFKILDNLKDKYLGLICKFDGLVRGLMLLPTKVFSSPSWRKLKPYHEMYSLVQKGLGGWGTL